MYRVWPYLFGAFLLFAAVMFVFAARHDMEANERSKNGTLSVHDGPVKVMRDEERRVTCYVYKGDSISCVRDTNP